MDLITKNNFVLEMASQWKIDFDADTLSGRIGKAVASHAEVVRSIPSLA